MNKIKKATEFSNILEYFHYLKDALDDFTEKLERSTDEELKNFYKEQINYIVKIRSTIKMTVDAKKEQIIHEKINAIKQEEIDKFINIKKEEKERISKGKLDLELEVAFQDSVEDFENNFLSPIAKIANEYDSSDFFVTDNNFKKSYLIKDENNELNEYSGIEILSKYLNNPELVKKIQDRHEFKMNFFREYVNELKSQYVNYPDTDINKIANDNLVLHSPELIIQLDNEYPYSSEDYQCLSDAYSSFLKDFKYLKKEKLSDKKEKLAKLTEKFNSVSKIPDGKNLEEYLLSKFADNEEKQRSLKSASEILKNDTEILTYFEKNNLLRDMTLSPETKLDYEKKLHEQSSLLTQIKNSESEIANIKTKIAELENKLTRLSVAHNSILSIQNTENSITEVSKIISSYIVNYTKPLAKLKKDYENYKESQDQALVPYKKVNIFQKIAGFFNGKNKLQEEYQNKCRTYESNINLLTQKAAMNKLDYNFRDKNELCQKIGKNIKDYMVKNPQASETDACYTILSKYKSSLSLDISSFKKMYNDDIPNLDNTDLITDIIKQIKTEKDKTNEGIYENNQQITQKSNEKNKLCEKYNQNSTMPIPPISTITYLNNIEKEYQQQLKKISQYKGESLKKLNYKINLEKIIEKDKSCISDEEKSNLENMAMKKAKFILNSAIDDITELDKHNDDIEINFDTKTNNDNLEIVI